MTEPKISIIVPAYNVENYIENCLISIRNQTYKNIEVLVVNDGSSDNTLDIILDFIKTDERFIVINQINSGVAIARKNGIKNATGDYIGFVDGDDTIEPNMYETLVSNAEKYNADISHCGYMIVTGTAKTPHYGTEKLIEQNNFTGIKDLLEGAFIEPGLCNKLFRCELFAYINYNVFENIKNNEDLLLNYYLFADSEKSVYKDFCPYNYIQREGSAANSGINEHFLFDPLKVIKIIEKEVSENKELYSIAYSRKIRQYIKISTAEIKDNPPLKAKCKQTLKEFRKMICKIIRSDCCPTKLKVLAIWAAFSPYTYKLVHRLHNKIKYK